MIYDRETAIEKAQKIAKDRLFIGNYPTGIVYADRDHEEHGNYKHLAYLNYGTLKLDIKPDCPANLRDQIVTHAKTIQDKAGQEYQVSTCGQTITLGVR